MGFDNDAGTSVSCSYRVDPHDSQERERRPVTHCEAFSKDVGSDGSPMAAESNMITFGLLHMLRTTGFSPRKMVFNISHDQGYAAMLTCLRHVEETVVPVSKSCVGGSVSLHNANDGCLPHMLGSGHKWPLRPRSVGRSPSQVAYQLPGDSGSI